MTDAGLTHDRTEHLAESAESATAFLVRNGRVQYEIALLFTGLRRCGRGKFCFEQNKLDLCPFKERAERICDRKCEIIGRNS